MFVSVRHSSNLMPLVDPLNLIPRYTITSVYTNVLPITFTLRIEVTVKRPFEILELQDHRKNQAFN